MLTLYSNQGSGNCYKVRLLLHQTGTPFRVVDIDVVKGEARTEEFRRKNPNGKVPTVELDDGTFLAESGAMLWYFAQGTPYWPESDRERAQALQWMFFEQYSHEPAIAVARFLVHYLDAEEQNAEELKRLRKKGYQALDVMEQHLAERAFFVGERYTIADIALYAYTHVSHQGGFSLQGYPAIRKWIDRVTDQPRHITIEHVIGG